MSDSEDVVHQFYVHTEPESYRGLFYNTPVGRLRVKPTSRKSV